MRLFKYLLILLAFWTSPVYGFDNANILLAKLDTSKIYLARGDYYKGAETGDCTGDYGQTSGTTEQASIGPNYAYATKVTLDCDATAGTIKVYVKLCHDTSHEVKIGLYSDSAGEPDALLYQSAKLYEAATESSFGYITASFSGLSLTTGDYWIAYVLEFEGSFNEYTASSGVTRTDVLVGFALEDPWDANESNGESTAARTMHISFP